MIRGSIILAFALACIAASGLSGAYGQEASHAGRKGTLTAVIPTDSPPTYFKDKDGKPAGFAVEVMDSLARGTGYAVRYEFKKDWQEIVEAVRSGAADVAPGMGVTEERTKVLAFTQPMDAFPVSLFVRAGSGIIDLREGLRVGVVKGSAAFEKITRQYHGVPVMTYDSFQNGLLDLLSGQIDAFCCPAPTLQALAKNAGLEDRITVVGAPVLEMKRSMAVRKSDRRLHAELDAAVESFVRTPEYRRIYHKWYGASTSYWTVRRIVVLSASLLLAVVIAMAVWRYYSVLRLNRELAVAEANFRTLFHKSADPIFLVRPDGSIFDVNEKACERYGYSRDELARMNVSQIDSPATSTSAPERTARVVRDGQVVFEAEHVTKNGTLLFVEANASSIMLNGMSVLISTCRDITDRKKAQAALADEKERLAVTLRSIGDGVVVTDIAGMVTLINRVAEQLTGWSQEEAQGKPLADVFHIINEITRERCENPVDKVLKTGGIVGLANNTALVRRDGTEIIIADSAAPIRDSRSEAIGVVLVFRDVTAQYRMEREIQKIQKLESLGILAGGLAHDFNNLLTAILGNVSLVKTQLGPEHRSFPRLTDAEKATRRATDLTQQLLTFARGGAPIRRPACMALIARETCGFALSGSSATCTYTVPASLWSVEVDKGQMSQVFNNLILNSVQAMPQGGVVHIAFENVSLQEHQVGTLKPGDYVRVSVRDEGVGIPDEVINRIFEPYFTTKAGGTGLGLATVLSIIHRHEGHISVRTKPGAGSEFVLYVPAVLTPLTGEGAATDGPRAGREGYSSWMTKNSFKTSWQACWPTSGTRCPLPGTAAKPSSHTCSPTKRTGLIAWSSWT